VSILKQREEEEKGESSRRNSLSFCCGPYGYILFACGAVVGTGVVVVFDAEMV